MVVIEKVVTSWIILEQDDRIKSEDSDELSGYCFSEIEISETRENDKIESIRLENSDRSRYIAGIWFSVSQANDLYDILAQILDKNIRQEIEV